MILLTSVAVACGSATSSRTRPQDVLDANDTGRVLPAVTPMEKAILQELGRLPPRTPRALGGATVVAEPAYHAASGRLCRALQISEPQRKARQRLACSDGHGWFFVPDVIGLDTSAE